MPPVFYVYVQVRPKVLPWAIMENVQRFRPVGRDEGHLCDAIKHFVYYLTVVLHAIVRSRYQDIKQLKCGM